MKTSINKAILLFGPPGAGKGTQARLISQKTGFINFDTGSLIEKTIYNPKFYKSKVIRRERKNFEAGKLCTPSWALELIRNSIEKISNNKLGIILSGSPRTLFETAGNNKHKGIINTLIKEYKKGNIIIFEIRIKEEESILRNSKRLICSLCNIQILRFHSNLKKCPFCGGNLIRRTLDKKNIIKERYKEYSERTKPIFAELKKSGFKIHAINGAPMPNKIFKSIMKFI